MLRVFSFFAVIFLVAAGAAWLADRPGQVMIDWQGYRIEVSLMTLVIAIGALVALALAVWSFIRWLLRSPDMVAGFFSRRRRDRGFDALSRGLIALGAGDARQARRLGHDALRLLKSEPAAKLLLAQTAQLTGDRDGARKHFEDMLEDPDTRLLGLHGLFVEAERQNEPVAARHYAEEAQKLAPGLGWAGKAVLGYQAAAGDWESAIATLERNAHAGLLDKPTLRRQKAVLLTARAMELEDGEPDRARTLAVEAHGLAADLVPAAVVAARLLTRRGDVRKASKVLEVTWKASPHPDVAEAYAHVRTGDSARDRLKRVKALVAMRSHVPEGGLAIARQAIAARDWAEARHELTGVLRTNPTQRAFLLMAELEEGEHGDRGRMREWLSRAVRAPRDPAWTADGIVLDDWAPVSPVSGRLDAFEWKAPLEELAGPAMEGLEEALVAPAPKPVKTVEVVEDVPVHEPEEAMVIDAAAWAGSGATTAKPDAEKAARAEAGPETGTEAKATPGPKPDAAEKPSDAGQPAAAKAAKTAEPARPAKPAAATKAGQEPTPEEAEEVEFPLPRPPDDPGPEVDEPEPGEKRRSRLFS